MADVAADPIQAAEQFAGILNELQQASIAAGVCDDTCNAMCASVRDRAVLIAQLLDITIQYPSEHRELAVSLHRCLWAAVYDLGEGLDALYTYMASGIVSLLKISKTVEDLRTARQFLNERLASLESYCSLVESQDMRRRIRALPRVKELRKLLHSVGYARCDRALVTRFATISTRRLERNGQIIQLRPDDLQTCRNAYRLSLSPDGKLLATCGSGGHLRVWDADSGMFKHAYEGHTAFVFSVAWSPDGRMIASASRDCSVRVWNVATKVQMVVLEGMWQQFASTPVLDVSWSPDGKRLLTTSISNCASVWKLSDADGDPELLHELKGHQKQINTVDWSPEGSHVVTGAQDGSVALWSVQGGDAIFMRTQHQQPVSCICFCVGGQSLVSASQDGVLIVWDLSSDEAERLKIRATLRPDNHHSPTIITALDWSPCGRWIVTGAWDGDVVVWNATTFGREITIQDDGGNVAGDVSFSPCGRYIFIAKNNGTVVVHRLVFR